MKEGELSESLRAFIRDHVGSIELLEVLLLLRDDSARPWTAEGLAAELRTQPRSTAGRLETLQNIGLARPGPDGHRFNDHSPHAPVVGELAKAYQTHRVAIIELVFSKPVQNIQVFADAFVIGKRGKSDG